MNFIFTVSKFIYSNKAKINTDVMSFLTSFHFLKFHSRIDFHGAPLCALDFSIIEYHVPSALLPPLLRWAQFCFDEPRVKSYARLWPLF